MLQGMLLITLTQLLSAPIPAELLRHNELPIVRIRAITADYSGHAYATGAHIGDGWILTCGHCVQSTAAGGVVDVIVLSSKTHAAVRQIQGAIVYSDPDSDLGLIRLEVNHDLQARLNLARRSYQVQPGDEVFAFDWERSDSSERLYSILRQVTYVNRYLGSANVETTGRPEVGSSGAPLLTADTHQIVGITQGALVAEDRGLYVGLEAIYQAFDTYNRLNHLSNRSNHHSVAFERTAPR